MHLEPHARRRLTPLILFAAALIPHLPTSGTAFLADTHAMIVNTWDAAMQDPWAFLTMNLGGGFRPLSTFSVFASAWLAEGAEPVHRGLNFLLHATTTLLVWRIALRLGLTMPGAVAAALLFAWSPCVSLAVPWIASRPDLTAGLTSALVFLAFLADRQQPTRGSLARLYGACLILIMSKEVVLLLPVVLVIAGRARRRYLPLLLFTAALVVIRVWFHGQYSQEIQHDYSPMTVVREPERLARILPGAGNVAFSMLTGTVGPHRLVGPWGAATSVLGWLLAAAVALATWRRVPLALACAVVLMIPNTPFLGTSLDGYRTYASAVFAVPVLVVALGRLGRPGRIAPFVLLCLALVGTFDSTLAWLRASDRFREALDRLEPHRRRIVAEWDETGQPMGIEVLGLPRAEGHIPLFPHEYGMWTLASPYFTYYRTTERTDTEYRQRFELGWYGGPAPEHMKAGFRSMGYPVRTIDLRE